MSFKKLVAVLATLGIVAGCGVCNTVAESHAYVVSIAYPFLDARAAGDPEFAKTYAPAKASLESAYGSFAAGCASGGKIDKALIAQVAGLVANMLDLYGALHDGHAMLKPGVYEQPEWQKYSERMREVEAKALGGGQ